MLLGGLQRLPLVPSGGRQAQSSANVFPNARAGGGGAPSQRGFIAPTSRCRRRLRPVPFATR
eukprot:9566327-Heterocapsa_arctica.AAC.1